MNSFEKCEGLDVLHNLQVIVYGGTCICRCYFRVDTQVLHVPCEALVVRVIDCEEPDFCIQGFVLCFAL